MSTRVSLLTWERNRLKYLTRYWWSIRCHSLNATIPTVDVPYELGWGYNNKAFPSAIRIVCNDLISASSTSHQRAAFINELSLVLRDRHSRKDAVNPTIRSSADLCSIVLILKIDWNWFLLWNFTTSFSCIVFQMQYDEQPTAHSLPTSPTCQSQQSTFEIRRSQICNHKMQCQYDSVWLCHWLNSATRNHNGMIFLSHNQTSDYSIEFLMQFYGEHMWNVADTGKEEALHCR